MNQEFKAKPIIKYDNTPKEILIPFHLIQELFTEGSKNFGGLYNNSAETYFDEDGATAKPKIADRFSPLLLGGKPDQYYFAYYIDRRGNYFAEETREQSACISTKPNKKISDDRLKELVYLEKSSGLYLIVSESINNKAFKDWDESKEEPLESSGSIKLQYKLAEDKTPLLTSLEADRVDEVMFYQDDTLQPCRWVRDLRINNQEQKLVYEELYILNRSSLQQRKDAKIEFSLTGTLENPDELIISIGYVLPSSKRVLAKSSDEKCVIFVDGNNTKDLDILKQDPSYSFLFEGQFSTEQVLTLLKDRVFLLEQQWDQPQSVFAGHNQLP